MVTSRCRMSIEPIDRERGPAQPDRPVGIFKPRVLRHVGLPCPYCTRLMMASGPHMVTREHILPRQIMRERYKGKIRQRLQLVTVIPAGYVCNKLKGGLTLVEFLVRPGISRLQKDSVHSFIEQLRAKHPHDVFEALVGMGIKR